MDFVDCRFGELDLGSARATDLTFEGCSAERLAVTAAQLEAVDLTGLDLQALDGAGHLRGAIISPAQLIRLAPAFAAHLGVEVAGSD